jgi:PEP-CTERM motif
MKRFQFSALAALVVLALAGSRASGNLLANPGFEEPVTSDGPPFVGSWEAFNGGAGSQAGNSAVMPRSGMQHVAMSIANTNNTFAGVFQDVPNLVPGSQTVFSGWHATPSNPFDVGVEIRVEWRNSVSGTEVSRTPNSTPVPGGQYAPFSLSAIVPDGADTARIVYAIQSFGPEPTNSGTVFLDDVSFVPEPSSTVLLGLGALALAGARHRRRPALRSEHD